MTWMSDAARNDFSGQRIYQASKLLPLEFRALGCTVRNIGNVTVAAAGGKVCYLYSTETSFTSLMAFRILKNKELAKTIFRDAGLNVSVGYLFKKTERQQAFQKLLEIGPGVIKPVDGHKGQGVSVNVVPDSFEEAWSAAAGATANKILLEEFFADGDEARYLVVDGVCVAVHRRIPPAVCGDGTSTIAQLVEQRNEIKFRKNPSRRDSPIIIDDHRKQILSRRGLTPASVPKPGEEVLIDWKSGLSTGGDAQDITADVHETMKKVAERIAILVPGLDVLGVDILAKDHSQPASPSNYVIVEANTRPGTRGHQFPDFGRPINVCRLIAESCLRRMGIDPSASGKSQA